MIPSADRRSGSVSTMALGLLVLAMMLPPVSAAASDSSVPWTNFSESTGCDGGSYTATPVATRSGLLPTSELILGPFGRYFGWRIGDIYGDIVRWPVPNSGGRTARVHRLALPAFQKVTEGLQAAAAAGKTYAITSVGSHVPRTIGGNHRISRHALGTAVDINPAQNPYREDGTLRTNMPDWFVQVWRDAGFCWGGDWEDSKDPMHFSWMGPTAGTTTGSFLEPLPPITSSVAYGSRAPFGEQTVFDAATAANRNRTLFIADGNGNGGPDVVAVRAHPAGAIVEVASSTTGWQQCSVWRWMVEGVDGEAVDSWVWTDIDGDSRQDLVGVDHEGSGAVSVSTATYAGDFEDGQVLATIINPSSIVATAGGDYDGDRKGDLWVFREGGAFEVWRGPTFSTLLHAGTLPAVSSRVTVADRTDDLFPEVFVLADDGTVFVYEKKGTSWNLLETAGFGAVAVDAQAFAAMDFDGDSRPDIELLVDSGELIGYMGNSSLGGSITRWLFNPDAECDGELSLVWQGTFSDDDSSVFQSSIEAIAADGITKGCNPPFNDEFCPSATVTRGQMAAFLVRALGLPPASRDFFTDDDDSIFQDDINRLAEAEITRGCGVPENETFCPQRGVTRGEMAAFLVRALALTDPGSKDFVDDDDSIFEADIEKLAAAGITVGCNPPTNDQFCPDARVTRGQMAAFLDRSRSG